MSFGLSLTLRLGQAVLVLVTLSDSRQRQMPSTDTSQPRDSLSTMMCSIRGGLKKLREGGGNSSPRHSSKRGQTVMVYPRAQQTQRPRGNNDSEGSGEASADNKS
ncbi:hypothetical protein F5Y06DRAFT_263688 [Hypoxylon sp. FL0890]|nr:hypothetical protein F5Y06DRAFT_263688 [Hypoxylon sp. FL0890]